MLLARIYEYLPLLYSQCGQPMWIIAFVLDPPVIERILGHVDEPTEPPPVVPARAPPQATFDFDQAEPVWATGRRWIRRPKRQAIPGTESSDRPAWKPESRRGQ